MRRHQEIINRHLVSVIQHEIRRKIIDNEKKIGLLRNIIFKIDHEYPEYLREISQDTVVFLQTQIGVIESEIEELNLDLKIL